MDKIPDVGGAAKIYEKASNANKYLTAVLFFIDACNLWPDLERYRTKKITDEQLAETIADAIISVAGYGVVSAIGLCLAKAALLPTTLILISSYCLNQLINHLDFTDFVKDIVLDVTNVAGDLSVSISLSYKDNLDQLIEGSVGGYLFSHRKTYKKIKEGHYYLMNGEHIVSGEFCHPRDDEEDEAARAYGSSKYAWYDPLVLDLNRDGSTELTGRTHFDFEGDGFKEMSRWLSEGDGFLVFDRNGDGIINDASELFGDKTPLLDGRIAYSGFHALAEFDSNDDGRITEEDERFEELRVWMDANSDGITDPGDLKTLKELGIKALNLANHDDGTKEEGNVVRKVGAFEWEDGTQDRMAEYLIEADKRYSIPLLNIEVPDSIRHLPNLDSRGHLYSLHQAMALEKNGVLKRQLEAFMAEEDAALRRKMVPDILYAWGDTSDAPVHQLPAAMRWGLDTRQFSLLQKYFGDQYTGLEGAPTPNPTASADLVRSFNKLCDYMYTTLMGKTHFAPWFESYVDTLETSGEFDFSSIASNIAADWEKNPEKTASLLTEMLSMQTYFPRNNISNLRDSLLAINEEIALTVEQYRIGKNSVLIGSDEDDTLSIHQTRCTVFGKDGDDYIQVSGNNNTIIGGKGDDVIDVVSGLNNIYANIQYIYSKGDGNDVIRGGRASTDKLYIHSTLRLLDLGLKDLSFWQKGNDWIIRIDELGEEITLKDRFLKNLEIVNDDLILNWESIQKLMTLTGTDGNDVIQGTNADEVFYGGKGNDILYGGDGSDTYIWDLGDSNDTIIEYFSDKRPDDINALHFGEGVRAEDVTLSCDRAKIGDSDLIITITSTGERISITGWYRPGTLHKRTLQQIKFHDGSVWDCQYIEDILGINKATDGDDTIYGKPGKDCLLYGGAGDDCLYGSSGDDILYGEDGDDYLDGGDGNDKLYGGTGNDCLLGGNGDDELYGGDGNDRLYGGDGDDFLSGGKGNDIFFAGKGRDTYLWDLGDGNDRIIYSKFRDFGQDVLQFGKGITSNDVSLKRMNNDLIIEVTLTGETITIQEFYTTGGYGNAFTQIKYADGSSWDANYIYKNTGGSDYNVYHWKPGDGDYPIYMNSYAVNILELAVKAENVAVKHEGRDIVLNVLGTKEEIRIHGDEGCLTKVKFSDGEEWNAGTLLEKATFVGTDGADSIRGSDRIDIIKGGPGDDTLITGEGDDIIIWNLGDGNDTVVLQREYGAGDCLIFGDGITVQDVTARRTGGDLVLSIAPTNEKITLQGWYTGEGYNLLGRIELSDGTILNHKIRIGCA